MRVNKRKIRILWIEDHGRCHDMFCDKVLMLRTARRAGDEEVINNYVLSRLKMQSGSIKYEVIE